MKAIRERDCTTYPWQFKAYRWIMAESGQQMI